MTYGWPALPPGPATPARILAVAGPATADAALSAGADLIDLEDLGPREVARFAARHPGTGFCARSGTAALTRHLPLAARSGAVLVCASAAAARRSGLPPSRVVVAAPLTGIAELAEAGFGALVDADDAGRDGGIHAIVAAAALACWLGAAIVRTRHPLAVRRAVDMAASIAGLRPPARAVRGLA